MLQGLDFKMDGAGRKCQYNGEGGCVEKGSGSMAVPDAVGCCKGVDQGRVCS